MLVLASTVLLYYTIWTLLLVSPFHPLASTEPTTPSPPSPPTLPSHPTCAPSHPRSPTNPPFSTQPFVDPTHPLQTLFPPRVWAIRIPVILLLLGGAVVGSFLSVVMIRSQRKKAVKERQKAEAAKRK